MVSDVSFSWSSVEEKKGKIAIVMSGAEHCWLLLTVRSAGDMGFHRAKDGLPVGW